MENTTLNNAKDGFHRHDGKIAWDRSPIIATPAERVRIQKAMFYDESEPTGMTKFIKELNARYIGFNSREIREWVRGQ